ncbi:thioredoxin family protein [Collimonas sp. H4R21]|jgi:thiol-disulfide isomerase/thioredoxin|uniref:Thioredoxin family protein n=1 Tax=Collimonas rhizosphaerae TaxID=3126357 RepID=A0ABU9PRX9_9BURK|nr:thioredoxin family protein [Collimonas sp. OK412]SFB93723.1 Thioredoxin [Collimonas sp. OK412]
MLILTLDNDNHQELATTLSEDGWVAACLCAAWCGSCREYFANFTALAQRHPHVQFVWIDIEDQAELIGDLDVDNFPTLLIQRGDVVAFLGPVEMDLRLAERILLAQMEKSTPELQAEAQSSTERRHWQLEANLLRRLADI